MKREEYVKTRAENDALCLHKHSHVCKYTETLQQTNVSKVTACFVFSLKRHIDSVSCAGQ